MADPGSSQTQDVASGASTITVASTDTQPPLGGIRIVDLTRIVAGPYCTMILADLGADVIKIEKPGSGDEARKWGPPYAGDTDESCYFISLNRNKKSVCVDIKQPQGQEIVRDLAKKSDVLVENYVPGKLDEVNLGYEQLKRHCPQLIYCSITGYGWRGPYRNKPGYDVIAASIGGLLHMTGPENGEPVKVGVAVTDMATGLYAHGAILAALIHRAKTGLGQKIECNLLSTQVAGLINIGSNYLNDGREAKRWGTAHESIVPYEAFATKDGHFTIGAGSDKQFADLCRKLSLPHVADNRKFRTNKLRVEHRAELIGVLRSVLKTRTNAEWAAVFEGSEFPCGPVNSLRETFDDVHVKSIGLVEEVDHPRAGRIRVVGPPVSYSLGGNSVRMAPPVLGEHTYDVLANVLGYDKAKVDELKCAKVIQ